MNKDSDKHKRIVRNRMIAITAVVLFFVLVLLSLSFALYSALGSLKGKGDGASAPQNPEESSTEEETVDIRGSFVPASSPVKEAEEEGDDIGEQFEEIVSNGEEMTPNALEIEERISKLTLEEKVAQLFFVTPESITGADTVTMAGDKTKEAIAKYHVGGIIYSSRNLLNPEQTKELLKNTAEYGKQGNGIPLFLGTDEEGGSITRLASNEEFHLEAADSPGKIGETGDPGEALKAGEQTGKYLKEYGFNLDFAPVADVRSGSSPEIGDRSFGSDGEAVSKMAESFAGGLNKEGIIACYKHFPGFGRADKNTDLEGVSITATRDELSESDLIPYVENANAGNFMIMAGHMSFPNITGDDTPASMSRMIITDYLKGELSFNGVVITDALNAGAIKGRYTSEAAAVNSLKAGADMLLCPADFEAAYNGVLKAVESGELSEDMIDRAVGRILNLKNRML